jgi:hypothetical protein
MASRHFDGTARILGTAEATYTKEKIPYSQ